MNEFMVLVLDFLTFQFQVFNIFASLLSNLIICLLLLFIEMDFPL